MPRRFGLRRWRKPKRGGGNSSSKSHHEVTKVTNTLALARSYGRIPWRIPYVCSTSEYPSSPEYPFRPVPSGTLLVARRTANSRTLMFSSSASQPATIAALRRMREAWRGPIRHRAFSLDDRKLYVYDKSVIRSFASSETERFFATGKSRRIPSEIRSRTVMRLTQLNAATAIDDLRSPASNRLEQLKGDRKGEWSIRVNEQWRVCFRFESGDAFDVEIVDYH